MDTSGSMDTMKKYLARSFFFLLYQFVSTKYRNVELVFVAHHSSVWNVYAFHCSDGDNFDSDNPAAFKAAKELCDVCNLFGYGEIKPSGNSAYESSMIELFRQLDADNFKSVVIAGKDYIWPCFCAFLARERHGATAAAA